MKPYVDVAIIGAGPSGAVAAALLRKQGLSVTIFERAHFPRFSIGESLLPQCMVFLEQAGMLEAVDTHGFQRKTGATFARNDRIERFEFSDKIAPGPAQTYQVQRAEFDTILAEQAQRQGAEIHYGHTITNAVFPDQENPYLVVQDTDQQVFTQEAGFVLDASGFGRVLPRLLDLDRPSSFPVRQSLFTHVEDEISDPQYHRDHILIVVHPEHADVWYWLIPFSNGRSSVGVVGPQSLMASDGSPDAQLRHWLAASPDLQPLLDHARYDTPVNAVTGYSADVSQLVGPRYALLGNAGEFLDPVFSSGVTIAMQSAALAARMVPEILAGVPRGYAHSVRATSATRGKYLQGFCGGVVRRQPAKDFVFRT